MKNFEQLAVQLCCYIDDFVCNYKQLFHTFIIPSHNKVVEGI